MFNLYVKTFGTGKKISILLHSCDNRYKSEEYIETVFGQSRPRIGLFKNLNSRSNRKSINNLPCTQKCQVVNILHQVFRFRKILEIENV